MEIHCNNLVKIICMKKPYNRFWFWAFKLVMNNTFGVKYHLLVFWYHCQLYLHFLIESTVCQVNPLLSLIFTQYWPVEVKCTSICCPNMKTLSLFKSRTVFALFKDSLLNNSDISQSTTSASIKQFTVPIFARIGPTDKNRLSCHHQIWTGCDYHGKLSFADL